MYTARIFESMDCSFDKIIESTILPDEFALFRHVFFRKHMSKYDIQIYHNDTLFYVGHIGQFLYTMLFQFKDEIDKEMD